MSIPTEPTDPGRLRGMSRRAAVAALRCRLLLCMAYPLLMAVAAAAEHGWLESALLPFAAAVLLAPMLARGEPAAWTVIAAVIILALFAGSQSALGMWPPVIITAAVGAWFGVSLRPGSVPLIERFAHAVLRSCGIRDPGDDAASRWMRAWTSIWAVVLGVSATALAWSAIGGHVTVWVWMTYALPVLLAGMLCGEFALRRVFLPQHAQMTLVGFLTALLATDWTDLAR